MKIKRPEIWVTILLCAAIGILSVGQNWRKSAEVTRYFSNPAIPKSQSNEVKITGPDGVVRHTYVDQRSAMSFQEMVSGLVSEFAPAQAFGQSGLLERSTAAEAVGAKSGFSRGMADETRRERTANVHIVARHADGIIFNDQWVHNLRVNGGINWQAAQMYTTTAPAAGANYVALSTSTATPAATDTYTSFSSGGEITATDLARVGPLSATHTSNATSYTLANTFSSLNTYTAVQSAGMFNGTKAGNGTLIFENTFSPVNMVSGDTLAITWTVNF